MSASLRMRFGVGGRVNMFVAELCSAQQEQSPGQTDRSTVQQADPSTAEQQSNDRRINKTEQIIAAQQRQVAPNVVVDHFWPRLLGQNKAEVELSQIALQRSENAEVKQSAEVDYRSSEDD